MVDLGGRVAAFANPPQNIVGSTLFLAYIALALYGTTAISTSLYSQYNSIPTPPSKPTGKPKTKTKPKDKKQTKEPPPPEESPQNAPQQLQQQSEQNARKRHIKIYAFLASISFATLSYHMLSFLISSYTAYSGPPKNLHSTPDMTLTSLQEWLLHTSLFDTFAKDLVRDGPSAAWTQGAVLATYFWNIWMADKAQQRSYPLKTLFPYILLTQILPISLTVSLFIIQLHLTSLHSPSSPPPQPPTTTTTKKTNPTLPTIILNASLLALAPLRNHAVFIPLVLLTRFILVTPFSGRVSLRDAQVVQSIAISGGFVFAQLFMMRKTTSMGEVVRGVWTGREAVKALGWDAQVGAVVHLVLGWGGGV
ncbi:hypothetical protein DM02DRAFT_554339 [Periconia macrospinosa]|uniref:Uncharacterized protein n=1 Tax=Periconia macrospinosa TaxID=97972 RepID=A0A2V1E4R4_9PLEO|nr:hypothetical protein DM02DRAFT_554339 [Periconia macrospinosa]